MGAGSNSTTIVCTHSVEITTDLNKNKTVQLDNEFDTKITTLTPDKVEEITEKISKLSSHDEELKRLKEIGSHTPILPSEIGTDFNFKREIVWKNAFGFALLHLVGFIGVLIMFLGICDIRTSIYSFWVLYISGQGVTMGAHRLWSHRAFKANKWLKLILLWSHTLAGQNCLWVWVRDHRQHHKYSDTDADPHNANRGFFFSHVGWLMSRKHPKVIEFGKKIDMSDLEADPWIMFQKKYYKLLYTIFSLLLPTSIPILFWNEDPFLALMAAFFGRTILNLNGTWLVNSAAHLWGTRPYDKTMFPVESAIVSLLAVGEGWHNYHHAFPWDYRASELGTPLNLTGFFIDLLADAGYIWDLKEATHNMVKNRVLRTGDDSHHTYGTPEGRSAIKTLFNVWKHPLNPSYNSIYLPQPKTLKQNGYALIEDELKVCEMDEESLKAQDEALLKQNDIDTLNNNMASCSSNNITGIQKYIVDKSEANKIMGELSKYMTDENINVSSSSESLNSELTINNNVRQRKSNKNDLNLTEDIHSLQQSTDFSLERCSS